MGRWSLVLLKALNILQLGLGHCGTHLLYLVVTFQINVMNLHSQVHTLLLASHFSKKWSLTKRTTVACRSFHCICLFFFGGGGGGVISRIFPKEGKAIFYCIFHFLFAIFSKGTFRIWVGKC